MKISDFNLAQLLRCWDAAKQQVCGYVWGGQCGKIYRAPEECREENKPIDKRGRPVPDRTEVYHLGNILNLLLLGPGRKSFFVQSDTGQVIFEGDDTNTKYTFAEASVKRKQLLLNCTLPPLPAEVRGSTDTSIVALIQVRDMALTCDVHKRPSARDVANFLDEVYSKRYDIFQGKAKGATERECKTKNSKVKVQENKDKAPRKVPK